MIILLDAGPLGLLCHTRASGTALACRSWLEGLIIRGETIAVADISWYEVRRELVRLQHTLALKRLDLLCSHPAVVSLPTSHRVWSRSTELWAQARQQGRPTADPQSLDADVILAATALEYANIQSESVIIATTNVGHLAQFAPAGRWQDIT